MQVHKFKTHIPNPEERAFVYQLIQEMADFAPGLKDLVIGIEKAEDPKVKKPFAVTLMLAPQQLGLQLRVEAKDLFSGISVLKFQAKHHLEKIMALAESESGDLIAGDEIPEYMH